MANNNKKLIIALKQRIITALDNSGLTIADFAKKYQRDYQFTYRAIKGNGQPGDDLIRDLLDCCICIRVSWLLGGLGPMLVDNHEEVLKQQVGESADRILMEFEDDLLFLKHEEAFKELHDIIFKQKTEIDKLKDEKITLLMQVNALLQKNKKS